VSWRWPGGLAALLSLCAGLGLYPVSAVSAGLLQQLLGYTNFSVPADAIPTTLTMALLAVLAYAIMAPFCEEFLFRRVIQPVYAQRGPRRAILWVGVLFIVFHLALLQELSIIPLSLALGYVFYRTRSLPASILTHFGANLPAALVITKGVFNLTLTPVLFSPPLIFGGLILDKLWRRIGRSAALGSQ
jgi:membrane protease YdiL (CAAX protease family)